MDRLLGDAEALLPVALFVSLFVSAVLVFSYGVTRGRRARRTAMLHREFSNLYGRLKEIEHERQRFWERALPDERALFSECVVVQTLTIEYVSIVESMLSKRYDTIRDETDTALLKDAIEENMTVLTCDSPVH